MMQKESLGFICPTVWQKKSPCLEIKGHFQIIQKRVDTHEGNEDDINNINKQVICDLGIQADLPISTQKPTFL